MYIHGDMTTAKFAVIEDPRNHTWKGYWATYSKHLSAAEVFEVDRDFIYKVSWMTEQHPYVVHFCQNGIEDICDDTPDIKTDGSSLLFAYDVFSMTRGKKSYTTEELISYANDYYDYRYEDDNIYGIGFEYITIDAVNKGLTMTEPLVTKMIDRKIIYEDTIAEYHKHIEENRKREERELREERREREERKEREQRQREREERERKERENAERQETLRSMRKDVLGWFANIRHNMYTTQPDVTYDMPFAQFGTYRMDTIENVIQHYFDTKFYDIVENHTCYYVPKDVYNQYGKDKADEDVCIAQTTTLNLTTLPTGVMVEGIAELFHTFNYHLWWNAHTDVTLEKIRDHNQLYLANYKPTASLDATNDGIRLRLGLVRHEFVYNEVYIPAGVYSIQPEDAFKWNVFTAWQRQEISDSDVYGENWIAIKTRVADFVRKWKQTNKHVIDRVRHNEDAWWSVERLPFVSPKPNTNLLYVAYLPHTDVIKVGRTQNWESRENAYRRISGPTPETTGDMRLCYVYETPTVGDAAIDKWLLYCAEDHIKQFARERMDLVGGNEFFRGQPVQDFCVAVDEYFKTLTTQDIISIRPEYEAKQFTLQNNYHAERFLDALEQL